MDTEEKKEESLPKEETKNEEPKTNEEHVKEKENFLHLYH